MSAGKSVSIIGSLDYRAYLRDVYEHLKATSPSFSFRFFAKRAGLRSPAMFKMAMDGERNLSTKTVEQFIAGLGLKGYEAEYFRPLVRITAAGERILGIPDRPFETTAYAELGPDDLWAVADGKFLFRWTK